MGYNAHFSKALALHDVPTTALIKYLEQLRGKSEEEKQRIMEDFAAEIEKEYPVKEKR